MSNVNVDLEALAKEMDQLALEIEHDQAMLHQKVERRAMLVQFLTLADKLRIEQPFLALSVTQNFTTGGLATVGPKWPKTIQDGIHEVMRSGDIWGPKDLSDEMLKRGWRSESNTPETIIANQLSRLSKDPASPVRRLEYGRYIYSTEPTEGVI